MPRVKGFVVGSDPTPGGTVWKVRVSEVTSQHNGKKLVVVSVRDGLELVRGLDVDFTVGTVGPPEGRGLRAFDVYLQIPGDQETMSDTGTTGKPGGQS